MTHIEIATLRLHHQQITQTTFTHAAEVVGWMGAMQAQDYAHAKWAIGLRLPGSTEADIEQAIDRGEIVRTHLLRPTWHFVAAGDVRWMLALSAPQIKGLVAPMNRQLGLDADVFVRGLDLMAKALEGHRHLTREELMAELRQAGIPTDDLRSAHLMFGAELDGLVCNGIRRGKQLTYALLEERIPAARMLDRPAAIAELARRYFGSHAPATLHDFHWWSGLKMGDARAGLEAIQPSLLSEIVDGRTYWWPADWKMPAAGPMTLYLLPAFDEFLVSYKDRSASLDPSRRVQTITGNGIFKPVVLKNGWVDGIWQRTVVKDRVAIQLQLFEPFGAAEQAAYEREAARFAAFLGKELRP